MVVPPLEERFGRPYIHLLYQASRIVVFVAYRIRPSWSWHVLVLSRPHDEWVDMFQPRMIGWILAESTMARRQLRKPGMKLYEALKTRHCADFELFLSHSPAKPAASTRKAERGALATVNIDYILLVTRPRASTRTSNSAN